MISNTINDAVTMAGGEGTLLAGRYRIVRQLGQGGMGSVWLAEDTQLDNKLFAIKMLPSILVSNKRAYRQLKDEALVAMQLVHPNIVQIRAFEENNGNPFLVMDYVDGQTLDDYLAEHCGDVLTQSSREAEVGGGGAGLPEAEVIRLLKPIAAALDYAHKKGVVHRDVKPGNVMVAKDGTPYILDFGIAREIQETMTRVTGKLSSGTLLYMSPEQLNGDAPRPAQDIYSFAAMAYECLKGEPPFSRGNIEFQIMNKVPEPLGPHIIISGQVMKGLAKKPEDRQKTCAVVLERVFCYDKARSLPLKAVTPRRAPAPPYAHPVPRATNAPVSGCRTSLPREHEQVKRPGQSVRKGSNRDAWAIVAVFSLVLLGIVGIAYYEGAERKRVAAERKAAAERIAAERVAAMQREEAKKKAEAEKAEMQRQIKDAEARARARAAKEKAEREEAAKEEAKRRAAEEIERIKRQAEEERRSAERAREQERTAADRRAEQRLARQKMYAERKTREAKNVAENVAEKAEAEKPSVYLTATLNGVPVNALVTEGLEENNVHRTPIDVNVMIPIGEVGEFAAEHHENGVKYVGKSSYTSKGGRQAVEIKLEREPAKWVRRPLAMNFCRHCGYSLKAYSAIGQECPSCGKKLFGD